MGIFIHNLASSESDSEHGIDLAAAVRQDASGLLGTTVQMADLVSSATGFMRKQVCQQNLTYGLVWGFVGDPVRSGGVPVYRCRGRLAHVRLLEYID